jgi:2-aminoadipate transaminase
MSNRRHSKKIPVFQSPAQRKPKTMSSGSFDFAPLLPAGLPPPAVRWTGRVKYDFTGGNNDPTGCRSTG